VARPANISKTWDRRRLNYWKAAMTPFALLYEDRYEAAV